MNKIGQTASVAVIVAVLVVGLGSLLFINSGLKSITGSDVYIEGLYMPEIKNLTLNSTYGLNRTGEELTAHYVAMDADAEIVYNITDWRLNGQSIALLNAPFENYTNTANVTLDYSTYGNNGSITNATWTSNGKYGGAYTFNGSGQRIDFDNNTFDVAGDMTITTWFKTSSNEPMFLFAKHECGVTAGYAVYINKFTVGKLTLMDSLIGASLLTNTGSLNDSQWHFIAIKRNATAKYSLIYIDGVVDTGHTNTTRTYISTPAPLELGSTNYGNISGCGGPTYFNGTIDEFTFYNQSLTTQQIAAIYQGEKNKIVSQELSVGQNWSVAVTPNDGTRDGLTRISNNLTIADNIAPVIESLSLNSTFGTNKTTENLTFYYNVSDQESDPLVKIIDWRIDGNSLAVMNLPIVKGTSNSTYTKDYSTNVNNGVVNGATFVPTYSGRGAYFFDGVNDYIQLSTDSLIGDQEKGTLMMWVTSSILNGPIPNEQAIYDEYTLTYQNPGDTAFGIKRSKAGNIRFDTLRNGYIDSLDSANASIWDGTWHHIAVTWSNNSKKIYINGNLENSTTHTGATNEVISGSRLGTIDQLGGYNFNGYIDDVRAYDRTLSAEEISAIYSDRDYFMSEKETKAGETWSAALTVDDGISDSSTSTSNDVTIINVININQIYPNQTNEVQNIEVNTTNISIERTFSSSPDFTFNVTAESDLPLTFDWSVNSVLEFSDYGILTSSFNKTFPDSGSYNISVFVNSSDAGINDTFKFMLNLTMLCVVPVDGMYINRNTSFCSGTYNLPNGIVVNASNIIVQCSNTTLNGSGASNSGITIDTKNNITIDGCSINNYANGIDFYSNPSNNITLSNNHILSYENSDGIMFYGSDVRIYNNSINLSGAIDEGAIISGSEGGNVFIYDNNIFVNSTNWGPVGIEINNPGIISGNIIKVFASTGPVAGITDYYTSDDSVLFQNNNLTVISDDGVVDGIYIYPSAAPAYFYGNNIYVGSPDGEIYDGIETDTMNATVINNTIIANAKENIFGGIISQNIGDSAVINNNNIFVNSTTGNAYGVEIQSATNNIELSNNNVVSYGYNGAYGFEVYPNSAEANNNNVNCTSTNYEAFSIMFEGDGNLAATNNSVIADSYYGSAGISLESYSNSVTANNNNVFANSSIANVIAIGAYADNEGNASASNNNITVHGYDYASSGIEIYSASGYYSITDNNTIVVTSELASVYGIVSDIGGSGNATIFGNKINITGYTAVYGVRGTATSSAITNNNIAVNSNSSTGYGILFDGTLDIGVNNNVVNASGDFLYCIGIFSGSNVNIQNNSLNALSSGYGYGIITYPVNATISGNNISFVGEGVDDCIYCSASDSASIHNNNLYCRANSYYADGIDTNGVVNKLEIYDNMINVSGFGSVYGLYPCTGSSGVNVSIIDNLITAVSSADEASGIWMDCGRDNFIATGNDMSVFGNMSVEGIYANLGPLNLISGNRINVSNVESGYDAHGINLDADTTDGIVSDNLITSSGPNGYAIYLSAFDNLLSNNTLSSTKADIFTNNFDYNNTLILLQGNNKLLFDNKFINVTDMDNLFIGDSIVAVNTSAEPVMNVEANVSLTVPNCNYALANNINFYKTIVQAKVGATEYNGYSDCSGTTMNFTTDHFSTIFAELPPVVDAVILNSTLGTNDLDEDLFCYANATDSDSTNITYFGEWYKNGDAFVKEEWNATHDIGPYDAATGIKVDSSGNVYVGGYSQPGINGHYYIIKYNSAGQEIWNTSYDSGSNSLASGIDIDSSGNVYITGYSGVNYYTIKYNSAGQEIWNATHAVGFTDYARGIAVDSSGNVYVTGVSQIVSGNRYSTVKYNSTGQKKWNVTFGGIFSANAWAIAVDSSGDVYVTGDANITSTSQDYFTIKYNSTTGQQIWNATYNSSSNDRANAIAVDSFGNVYVTGESGSNYHTIKYNSAGQEIWNATSTVGADSARGIAVDLAGNVYVTGNAADNYFTIKYNSAGQQAWNATYNGGNIDFGRAIAVDSSGDVYVTGQSNITGIGDDYHTIKYKDGFVLANQNPGNTVLVSRMDKGFTNLNDNFTCNVSAFDGIIYSDEMASNDVQIIDYTFGITEISPNATNEVQPIQENDTNISIDVRGPDNSFNVTTNSVVPLTFTWFVNGIQQVLGVISDAFSSLFNFIFGNVGEYNITAIANDSIRDDTFTWFVNVSCIEPTDGMIINESTLLCDGTYDLPNGIVVNTSNIIVQCNQTILNGSGSNKGIYVDQVNNVTISGCTIEDYETGVQFFIAPNGTSLNNVLINNERGFYIYASNQNLINNNNISNNTNIGIYGDNSLNLNVFNNSIIDNGAGIEYISSSGDVLENVVGNGTAGIYISGASNISIKNNIVANTSNYAIYFASLSSNVTISENTLEKNSYRGIFLDIDAHHDNLIVSNNISGSGSAIVFGDFCNNNNISGNLIFNNTFGISMQTGSSNNTISGNTLSNNSFYGVLITSSYNNSVLGNSFYDNNAALHLASSDYNSVSNNNFSSDSGGIELQASGHNLISNNIVSSKFQGIYSFMSSNNNISNNIVRDSESLGIILFESSNTTLMDNLVSNATEGVRLSDYSFDNLIKNNFINQTIYGITLLDSQNNTLFNNSIYSSSSQDISSNAPVNNTLVVLNNNNQLSFYDKLINVTDIDNLFVNDSIVAVNTTAEPQMNVAANVSFAVSDCNLQLLNATGFYTDINAIPSATVYHDYSGLNCTGNVMNFTTNHFSTIFAGYAPNITRIYPNASNQWQDRIGNNVSIRFVKGTNVRFNVTAVDINSPSLTFRWYVNDTLMLDENAASDSDFNYTFANIGNYLVRVIANDSTAFDAFNFNVEIYQTPTGGGGGGGGGTGIIMSTPINFTFCNGDFVCGEWGDCIEGKQTRICNDQMKCYGPKTETKTCTLPIEEAPAATQQPTREAFAPEVIPKKPSFFETNMMSILLTALLTAVVIFFIAGRLNSPVFKYRKDYEVAAMRKVILGVKDAETRNKQLAIHFYNDAVRAYQTLSNDKKKIFEKEFKQLRGRLTK